MERNRHSWIWNDVSGWVCRHCTAPGGRLTAPMCPTEWCKDYEEPQYVLTKKGREATSCTCDEFSGDHYLWHLRENTLQDQRNEALNHLRNLLARIHGDGGHYTEQYGLQTSVEDAENRICDLKGAVEDLQAECRHLQEDKIRLTRKNEKLLREVMRLRGKR